MTEKTMEAFGIDAATRKTRKPGETRARLKSLVKYILFPSYRRSYQIANYQRHGYTTQEALAKVKAIEA
ncbi:hypothetical protein ACFLTJ_03445 [Chloroflexota bacterium]